jgi:hypothetical protein
MYGHVSPRDRSGGFITIPSVSTSNSAVYYLDGDAALMRLRPGGSPEHVRDLPGTASVPAAFAVSPDDRRIAIALLTYDAKVGSSYRGMKLYVEDLDGSHHVDLFASSTVAEWPVGWHGTDLVIAVDVTGSTARGGSLTPYPYFALGGIHVADSMTGIRKATLCGGLPAVGLGTPDGILCAKGNGIGPTIVTPVPMTHSDWSGKETPIDLSCIYGGLQPNGKVIACDTFKGVELSGAGSKQTLPAPSVGPDPYTFVCWVGHDHLLLETRWIGATLLDVRTGATQTIDTRADWIAGAIPGAL